MSNAALPPLPSIRAKNLESRALKLDSLSADTAGAKSSLPTPVVPRETTDARKKEQSTHNDESKRLIGHEPSINASERNKQRSEQLEMLHQREQKVFGNLPPLEPNLACEAIHQYLSTTSSFLNSYVADVNSSLEGTNHKLNQLEKQLSILESKLASIPGLMFPNAQGKENHGYCEKE